MACQAVKAAAFKELHAARGARARVVSLRVCRTWFASHASSAGLLTPKPGNALFDHSPAAKAILAQQMLAKDRDAALFRLGISEELADILLTMSPAQIVKLASTNMMLCRFRFDDHAILGLVTQPHRDKGLQQSQMSILLARQAVEQIS